MESHGRRSLDVGSPTCAFHVCSNRSVSWKQSWGLGHGCFCVSEAVATELPAQRVVEGARLGMCVCTYIGRNWDPPCSSGMIGGVSDLPSRFTVGLCCGVGRVACPPWRGRERERAREGEREAESERRHRHPMPGCTVTAKRASYVKHGEGYGMRACVGVGVGVRTGASVEAAVTGLEGCAWSPTQQQQQQRQAAASLRCRLLYIGPRRRTNQAYLHPPSSIHPYTPQYTDTQTPPGACTPSAYCSSTSLTAHYRH